jgi:hypothetical protein
MATTERDLSGTQSPALSDTTKRRLKSLVVGLRRLLEEDLGRELVRLGIDPAKNEPAPVEKLTYLGEDERGIRAALDAVLQKERAAAGTYRNAVEALVREAAYTHLNRLVGLKCLELRGHLEIEGEPTEAVTCRTEFGGRSKWLWTLRTEDRRYRTAENAEELLWREGLTRAYQAVGREIRVLFDVDDPYALLWPSHKVLREVVDRLNELPEDAYRADELLGWVYQYFQTEEKARVFEETRTKKKKIAGPDIIPVTQLYTERYMVDFLLQNSIGARWMEMYPDSDAHEAWPYYVTPATPHTRKPKPLKEWTILDPCVGSGHFLVVAFVLLVYLYEREREMARQGRIPAHWAVPEEDVAVTILERNLHGIDIDARSVQLTTLALYLKAKELGLSRTPRINAVAADASFLKGPAWESFLAGFEREPSVRRVLAKLADSLENIRELGSLLRPEVELERIIEEEHKTWESQVRRGVEQGHLFADMAKPRQGEMPFEQITDEMFWDRLSHRAEQAIRSFLDEARARGEITEQVVAGEAQRGFAFMELCKRRYDVVCTNPPYMGSKNMGKVLKEFVSKHYKPAKRDLYTSFVTRCGELAMQRGIVAMVTQRGWTTQKHYSKLRKELLQHQTLRFVADLGPGAFSEVTGENVTVTLTVLLCTPAHDEIRSRTVSTRGMADVGNIATTLRGAEWQSVSQRSFLGLPGHQIICDLTPGLIKLLSQPSKLRQQFEAEAGLWTGDDSRFVRYYWEIDLADAEWVPLTKGGSYRKWYGLTKHAVRWGADGEDIKRLVCDKYPRAFKVL